MTAPSSSAARLNDDVLEWPLPPTLEPRHFMTPPMESEHHLLALLLFYQLMKEAFRGRNDVFVGADLACYFSELQVRNFDVLAPDGLVVIDVPWRERQGWVSWLEDGRLPDLVVEHMSPSTRARDLGRKLEIYDRTMKVREYYAFDLKSGELHAFQRERADLTRVPGERIYSPVLGAWVGVSDAPWMDHSGPFLRLFAEDGALIPTLAERAAAESERAAAESERAAAESARADAESARAVALEAELAALKARLGGG